jgi:hypothetical protein
MASRQEDDFTIRTATKNDDITILRSPQQVHHVEYQLSVKDIAKGVTEDTTRKCRHGREQAMLNKLVQPPETGTQVIQPDKEESDEEPPAKAISPITPPDIWKDRLSAQGRRICQQQDIDELGGIPPPPPRFPSKGLGSRSLNSTIALSSSFRHLEETRFNNS